MGLDVYLYKGHALKQSVRVDSQRHPEHPFKVGYFTSPYNDAGIDQVLRSRGIPTLEDIFQAGEQYVFKPDWAASLAMANESLRLLREHQASPEAKFDVITVSMLPPDPRRGSPSSAKEARAKFLEHWRRWRDEPDRAPMNDPWYRSDDDLLSPSGLKVHAIMLGQCWGPTNFVVVEADPRRLDWYVQALEVVVETCEHVLAQPDAKDYWLCWSV